MTVTDRNEIPRKPARTLAAGEIEREIAGIRAGIEMGGVYIRHHSHEDFVYDFAGHWGYLTSVHPFVDGNSRAQRVFLDQLAREVGWAIEWRELSVEAVHAARNFAGIDDGAVLADVLRPAIKPAAEVPTDTISTAPCEMTMTVGQHWQAMLEHYETVPEQAYIYRLDRKAGGKEVFSDGIRGAQWHIVFEVECCRRYCQDLWISKFQATSAPVEPSCSGVDSGVMSAGRSSSLPLWKTAPARTSATRCGALTARQRACAASISYRPWRVRRHGIRVL